MFAVLHLSEFALQSVLRTEPDTQGKPAALFAATNKKSVVLATNAPARACGVEVGMTAPQAVARCPALLIRTPSLAAEAEARAALLAAAVTLSPTIEDTAPGVCTVDLRANTTPAAPLATAALTQLSVLGFTASAGIAPTPLLALYAARQAEIPPAPSEPTQPLLELALVSETSLTPYVAHAERVITVSDAPAFLAPLPLSVAEPSFALGPVLANWGLRTLGDLTALPRDEIIRRFGAEGRALWQRATGGEPRPLHPVTTAPTFSADMAFEDAVETLEPLLFILRRFLDRLVLELRAAQHVATELHLALRLEDDTEHARRFRLPEPTADADILFRALHTHLESVQTVASICAVKLRLTPARPLVRQHGLFDTGLRDPHGFAETLARVSALVNADRVGTPCCEPTHRPDTFKLTAPATVIAPASEPPLHPPLGLPLRRFRPPLLAQLEFDPDARRPTFVYTHRFHGNIAELRGPWRSDGEWWQQDRAWQRLEYDIALTDGGLYRLLQIGDEYFIEGEYD